MTSRMEENPLLAAISTGESTPDGLVGEDVFEAGPSPKERAGGVLRRLRRLFAAPFRRRRNAPPAALARQPSQPWTFLVRTARRLLVPAILLGLLLFVVRAVTWLLDLFR
jgi:hypothetical protein